MLIVKINLQIVRIPIKKNIINIYIILLRENITQYKIIIKILYGQKIKINIKNSKNLSSRIFFKLMLSIRKLSQFLVKFSIYK
jgi:serine protease inhibitor